MKTDRKRDRPHERLEAALAPRIEPIDERWYENVTAETADAFAAVRLALKSLIADVIASSKVENMTGSRSEGNFIESDLAYDIASIIERLETGIAAENEAMDGLIRRLAIA